MTSTEGENRNSSEIILSSTQKSALFFFLTENLGSRIRTEVRERGEIDGGLLNENDSLRKLVKQLVTDLKIDVGNYGPAESLIFMGFSDCFSDEKLAELARVKPDSDTAHDREWASNVRAAAEYFLQRRRGH